jgi:Ctr copper transporter family
VGNPQIIQGPSKDTRTGGSDVSELEMAEMSGGMQMVFTGAYRGAPILFSSWAPKSAGGFVGSFIAIFLAAFCFRALVFIKSYLTAEYWGRSIGVVFPW